DDENAEEKDADKSEGPSGEKEGQASPAQDTEASGKQGLGGQASPFHEEGPADG
ncbi:hypothetical protein S245_052677, partial [Arachis hypogaea]